MPKLQWYLRRLQAMSPAELVGHARRRWYQRADRRATSESLSASVESTAGAGTYPSRPSLGGAPGSLRSRLAAEWKEIQDGCLDAFGHLPLRLTAPPAWQTDALVGFDATSDRAGFDLNHRQQPGGADIKVIWEPNRWNFVVRAAQHAFLNQDPMAVEFVVRTLEDWVLRNPPYRGLNWSSALETGVRLIQFAWVESLLSPSDEQSLGKSEVALLERLKQLRGLVVPAHAAFTWRYRSFGSSANNHLIGELAGLVVARVRWHWAASSLPTVEELREHLDREILLQFAPDGGNREQALGYHLFSWEFCWQAAEALEAAGVPISQSARERLITAAKFFAAMKPPGDPWDFGDTDNAYVTPLFRAESTATREWSAWFKGERSTESEVVAYWLGGFLPETAAPRSTETRRSSQSGWQFFGDSGYGIYQEGDWFLRWDLSPLGFLGTAAHGHLDALHLSIWFRSEPVIIDPGTGCYYSDPPLRDYLASWEAHNGPMPVGVNHPQRWGTFLWGAPHPPPEFECLGGKDARATLRFPNGSVQRTIRVDGSTVRVEDVWRGPASAPTGLQVGWKFAPHLLAAEDPHGNQGVGIRGRLFCRVEVEGETARTWASPAPALVGKRAADRREAIWSEIPLSQLCSPAFRAIQVAPRLLLRTAGHPGKPLVTRFRMEASPA